MGKGDSTRKTRQSERQAKKKARDKRKAAAAKK